MGAPGRIRTCDARFRKPTLYPLSYEGGGPVATGAGPAYSLPTWLCRAARVVPDRGTQLFCA